MQVNATDGSEELCRLASEYTGIPVRQMLFEDLDKIIMVEDFAAVGGLNIRICHN